MLTVNTHANISNTTKSRTTTCHLTFWDNQLQPSATTCTPPTIDSCVIRHGVSPKTFAILYIYISSSSAWRRLYVHTWRVFLWGSIHLHIYIHRKLRKDRDGMELHNASDIYLTSTQRSELGKLAVEVWRSFKYICTDRQTYTYIYAFI